MNRYLGFFVVGLLTGYLWGFSDHLMRLAA